MKNSSNIFIFIIIPILVAGLFFGMTTPLLCLAIITLLLVSSDKDTSGFFLLLFGGVIGGAMRSLYPFLPLYGLILNFVGVILIHDKLISCLFRSRESLYYLFAVLFLFITVFLYSIHNNDSSQKILGIVFNGILYYLAFFTFDKSKSLSPERLSILLILVSLFLFSYTEYKYNFHPTSVLDFNWFRSGLSTLHYENGELPLVDYQEVGMDLTYAMTLIFGCHKIPRYKIIYLLIGSYLILMSGARQALLGFAIMLFLRISFFSDKKAFKRLIIYFVSFILLLVFWLLIKNLNIDIVNNTLEGGDSERLIIWAIAFNLFIENPIWGVGLGGFHYYANEYPWPHNFILEILCECGLYGAIILMVIILLYVSKNKLSIRHLTVNNVFYFLFVFAFFIRVMVSSDLTQSIGLFSALFAITDKKRVLLRNTK